MHRYLSGDSVFLADCIKYRWMQFGFIAVHVFDEPLDAAGKCKVFFFSIAVIKQGNFYAVVQERQLTQSFRQYIEVKFDQAKGFLGRQKLNDCSFLVRVTHNLERSYRFAVSEFHEVFLAVSIDGQFQPF